MTRAYNVAEVERKWRDRWTSTDAFRAPSVPDAGREKFFIHDAAPFPNGPLHLGHVRTYVLGDMTARYHRGRGCCVLYVTGFDAFGLPIELEAAKEGTDPREFVQENIRLMTRQLKRLGISYDFSRIPRTCDPDCYRWTQWLFLELLEAGLVERRTTSLDWCPDCRTTLARMQVEDGRCWRCGTAVLRRSLAQWFVLTSKSAPRLRESIHRLDGWSDRVKKMLIGFIEDDAKAEPSHGNRAQDWIVSRQRSWGTPIPIVHCEKCGVVPVPREELPVRVGEVTGGPHPCPSCGSPGRRETNTLDCFFDDIWCFLQPIVLFSDRPGFTAENLNNGWLPVDRAQSGLDTAICFHLYRFLGHFLFDRGLLVDPEPISSFIGNDMVLSGGRKMSKHHGNAVSPDDLMNRHGADALRVAILWAAGPHRAIQWESRLIERAAKFLDDVYTLVATCAPAVRDCNDSWNDPSRAAASLQSISRHAIERIGQMIEKYRPNVALEELSKLHQRIARFAATRVPTNRFLDADARVLLRILTDFLDALSPFAPHLAAECLEFVVSRQPAAMTSTSG